MPASLRNPSSPLSWLLGLLVSATAPALAGAGAPSSGASHPVIPGFERFFTGAKADTVRGGQLLLGELNCTSCHRPDAKTDSPLLVKQAPILDGVGSRV